MLDSAERLFADRGFFGVSVRDITRDAGVRLASVNYHFNSKEELFRDVVVRRAEVISQDRFALLSSVPKDQNTEERVRAIVNAFVRPLVTRAQEHPGYRDYFALIAQVANTRTVALALLAGHFNQVAEQFIAALRGTFPEAPLATIQHAYHGMLGATLLAFAGNRRLDILSKGAQRSDDYEAVASHLVPFLVGGLMQSCL